MRYLIVACFLFTAVTINTDGVISDGEWDGAEEFAVGEGNKVFLKHEGDKLYVAVKAAQSFWAHFYLSDGKRVKVMHASAALGVIEYKLDGDLWRTNDKSFVYELRDRAFDGAKFDAYYSKNGWVANNNNFTDKRTIEARFDLSGFKPQYFACVIAAGDKFFPYPEELKDGTTFPRLVQGYPVDSLKFEPMKWRKL